MLILIKGENQVSENRFEEWNEFVSCILLKSGKSAATSLLHTLVVVEDHPEQLRMMCSVQDKNIGERNPPPPGSAQRTVACVLLKWAECTSQRNGRESSKRSIGQGAGKRSIEPGKSVV